MAYIPDLDECTYVQVDGHRLVAVGWLDSSEPGWDGFPAGRTPPGLLAALERWDRDHPLLPKFMGWHRCNLDGCTDGQARGASELFVTHALPGTLYCAPSLVRHYISAHSYRPPEEFVRAVLDGDPDALPALRFPE